MACRECATDVARGGDLQIIDGLWAVLGLTVGAGRRARALILQLMMALALVVGAVAIGSPAQARTETFSAISETVAYSDQGYYSDQSALEVYYYTYTKFGVFYSAITIPAGKVYSSASVNYNYTNNNQIATVSIVLLSGAPPVSAAGLDQVRAGTSVGSLGITTTGSGAVSLSSTAVAEMNRLSAAGGGTLYLGAYVSDRRYSGAIPVATFSQFQLTAGLVPVPTISTISPNIGARTGGTAVTINGTGLAGATSVTFDGAPATIVGTPTATAITVNTPSHAEGLVDVVVTTSGGTATRSGGFSYVPPAPTISNISPNTGSTAGGTQVFLTGTDLRSYSGVTFGGQSGVINVALIDGLTALVTAPAHVAGTVDVVYTTNYGSVTVTGGYTYLPPAPAASNATASAVAYNTGSAAAATFSLAAYATNSPTGYTVGSATTANGGFVSIDNAGLVSYTPPAGFRGNDSFTFTASNPGGTSSSATVTVPVANPVFTVTLPETTGQIGVAYNTSGAPVTISGGKAPYAVTAVTGYSRALSFDAASQVLSGRVTEDGNWTVVFTITDSSTGTGPYTSSASASLVTVYPDLPTATSFTAPAVVYNNGSAPATSIDVAAHTGGVINGFYLNNGLNQARSSITTTQGGSASIDTAGMVSYTPPVGFCGNDSFQFIVANARGNSSWETVTVPVGDPVLTVTLPQAAGVAGQAYNGGGAAVTVSGGKAPYTNFSASGLPAGLTMDSAGVISGAPSATGAATVIVTMTDSSTGSTFTGSASANLTIAAPTITLPASLPAASVGVGYSHGLTASGGTADYSFSLDSGTLPQGMNLSTDGTLSGEPTQSGSFPITIRAADSTGGGSYSGVQSYVLVVGAPTLTMSPGAGALPQATQHAAYSQVITAAGGTASYGFTLQSGALPDGLGLSASGLLSGAPTEVGTFSFAIRATDSSTGGGPFTLDTAYSLTVSAPPPPSAGDVAASVAANSGANTVAASLNGAPAVSLAIAAGPAHGTASVSGFNLLYTPTAGYSGTDSLSYVASNLGGDSAPATVTITVTPPTLALGDLPATGQALTTYSGAVTASLGTAPYSFTRTGGTLPAGLTLAANGVLSGEPTEAGTFAFTIEATDAYSATGTRDYTLVLAAPTMMVGPASLPDGVSAVAYSRAVTASGGASPYSYAVTAGGTPTGLTLSTAGVLSGVAGAAGTFNFTVTATDSHGFTGSRAYSMTVSDPVIAITSPASGALPDGVGGVAYSRAFTATGGQGSHSFALAGGSLPPGLTLSSAGVLSGTPTQVGSFSFTVTATDASPAPGPFVSASAAYTLEIVAPTITLTPAAGALPGGLRTTAYSQAITASGGVAPYAYAVTAGALPDGLALASDGALSGTPTTSGSNSFTVMTTDAYGFTRSAAYTLEVGTPVAVVQSRTVVVVGGQSVVIDASQGAAGLDLIAAQIVTAPAHGATTIDGLRITYTADGTYSGSDSFTYAVRNPGGLSAPATVTITVNAAVRPGPDKTATILAGQTAVVELTEGAFGSPFTGAAVASISPSNAGAATIAGRTGSDGKQLYDLSFKPDNAFNGVAVVSYTLSNAFATSAPGTVTITVEARPDPTQDPEVTGLISAQGEAARRFATAQISNVNGRMEQLHDGRGGGGFSSGFSLSGGGAISDPWEPRRRRDGLGGLMGALAGDVGEAKGLDDSVGSGACAPGCESAESGPGGFGVWVSGAATFGQADARRDRKGFKFSTDGLTIGVDERLGETLVLGGAVGWATDASRIGDNGTRSEADAWSASLYGSWQPARQAYLDVVVGYGKLDFDSRRYVTASGDFAYGRRDGDQWFGAVTAGWDFRDPRGVHLTPYGRMEATRSVLGSFTEEGGGAYALAYDRQTARTLTGAFGLRGDYAVKTRLGQAQPSFRIEYSYDLQGSGSQLIRYTDWLDGAVYSLDASPLDRNRILYGLDIDLLRRSGMRLGLGYEGSLSDDQTSGSIRAKLQTPF